eukprot:gnl/TRDRNA2_/TRDRNA2_159211_c0_seq2.p1 gnl/TRDRNA2_/TRDRNA2_159211_c0~~gnl/TRDRNA2_/TRDRNA2_159211_c0_seq2.p1  ORF type:complete len:287 (-),score=32.55 gnl/TRDRNA2_/TRDRNA2_159211_c0_seq2:14-874(-)
MVMFERSAALQWMLIPLLFVTVLATNIKGMSNCSITTVTVVRNVMPLWAMIVELKFWGIRPAWTQLMGILLLLSGAALYIAFEDKSSSTLSGIVWVLFYGVAKTVEHTLLRYFLAVRNLSLSTTAMLLINNAVGALLLLVFLVVLDMWLSKELWRLWDAWLHIPSAPVNLFNAFWLVVAGGALRLGSGCADLQVQRRVTATTLLFLTNFNMIALVAVSEMVFGDRFNATSACGALMALAGGIIYGFTKRQTPGGREVSADSIERELFKSTGSSIELLKCGNDTLPP